MFVKNGRLIFKEEEIYEDIKKFQNYLREVVSNNEAFNYQDIGIDIIYDDECFNENNGFIWREISIKITNFDKVIDGNDSRKYWKSSIIKYVTDSYEPTLVFQNNMPEFYIVFDLCNYDITNMVSWETENVNVLCYDNNSENDVVELFIINNYIDILEF